MDLEKFQIETEAEQIALSLKELALIGRLIFNDIKEIILTLRSGRAPIKLEIPTWLPPIQNSYQAFNESLVILENSLQKYQDWKKLPGHAADPQLLTALDAVTQDWETWLDFSQLSKSMLSRLELIANAERLSSGAWASLLDVWEELERLATATADAEEEEATV